MVSFIFLLFVVWAIAVGTWFVVSKYANSADVDRVKARLLGSPKQVKRAKMAAVGEPSVMQKTAPNNNKVAQALIDKYSWGPKLAEFLEQAGLAWPPARLVHLTLVAFACATAAVWLLLPLPKWMAVLAGALVGAGPFLFVYNKKKSRLKRFEELFPETLEFISRSMRAGHAFSVSLEMIHKEFEEPISGEFRRAFEEHNLGLPLDVALLKLSKRVPSLDVHFFVSAVLLQKRTGGNLAEILDKLAYVIRERFKLRGRIRAVSAHGKMTATALSCIPIGVAVLMFYTNPDYVKFFFNDDVGNIMLGSAVGLQLIGYLIMRQIVNIEV
jgi:tight adherence protein B